MHSLIAVPGTNRLPNMKPDDLIQPSGEVMQSVDLLAIASITQQDLERAIATANPTLRSYLKAKPTK